MKDIILYVMIRDRNSVRERAFTLTINIKSLATQLVKYILRYSMPIINNNDIAIRRPVTITRKNLKKNFQLLYGRDK